MIIYHYIWAKDANINKSYTNTVINYLNRYQKDLKLENFYPFIEGHCACGCGKELTGKQKKWSSEECSEAAYKIFAIYKGNTGMIRKALYLKDRGFCHNCGVLDDKWEADHIFPVFMGGGYCGLENFQTLCQECHKEKSKIQIECHRSAISSHEASILPSKSLYALGEVL